MNDVEMEITDAGVAVLRFNRPEKKNALRYVDLDAFEDYIAQAAASPDVRSLVVTGSGGLSVLESIFRISPAGIRRTGGGVRRVLTLSIDGNSSPVRFR